MTASRTKLERLLKTRVLVLDGAMGTLIQPLSLADCPEAFTLTQPERIAGIHRAYLQAGADIIETHTFGANPLVLKEYGLDNQVEAINLAAARIARQEADRQSSSMKPRFVAGSIGPTHQSLTFGGNTISFDDLACSYEKQITALISGGVDYLLFETCHDTLNLKAGLLAASNVFKHMSLEVPIAVSATLQSNGRLLSGQTPEALWAALSHTHLLYFGLNCGGTDLASLEAIAALQKSCPTPLAFLPNAGTPEPHGVYTETPVTFRARFTELLNSAGLNLVGGCCGSTPAHILELSTLAKTALPRRVNFKKTSILAGLDLLELKDHQRPYIVGEKTNISGSKTFKNFIQESNYKEAAQVALEQVKAGARLVDICLTGSDKELVDMRSLLGLLGPTLRAPLLINATDPEVIAVALQSTPGRPLLNSISLQHGEAPFGELASLVKKFGAAVIVGCIGPKHGMALTAPQKLEVAEDSFALLTQKYGISAQDIFFDPLVFPCSVTEYISQGLAQETLAGLKLIKRRFGESKTVLGISNISYGLPRQARGVLNSVFLHHCALAGLDLAIANPRTLQSVEELPTEALRLAEALLWERDATHLHRYVDYFRIRSTPLFPTSKTTARNTPDDALSQIRSAVILGETHALQRNLSIALHTHSVQVIVHNALLNAMEEVCRRYEHQEIILGEALQSAETLQSALLFLATQQPRILLATVQGDIHDIGKNIVSTLLSCHGFAVLDLGTNVSSDTILTAIHAHAPALLLLSGMIARSAHETLLIAEALTKAQIKIPLIVGGAAFSEAFVEKNLSKVYLGPVFHAKNALAGALLATKVCL